MPAPETSYARVGGADVAFQVVGDGPLDLVYHHGMCHLDLQWDADAPEAAFNERLASFSRLILFDRRGSGASEQLSDGFLPTADGWCEDLLAVLDAAGSAQAAIFAEGEAGPPAIRFFTGDFGPVIDEVATFLTGRPVEVVSQRILTTVLFTDIVDSTRRAVAEGDTRWRGLLDEHDRMVRAELVRFGGIEVNTTGDGFVARFESPAQAIRCARAMAGALGAVGLPIRAGVHTGECELRGTALAGQAVHVAARVAAAAGPGEVLVSRIVTELVAGSGLSFDNRGEFELKGVPASWPLFAAR